MVLALDPAVQRVWRSPHALQFGVERALLVLDALEPVEERMIAALDGGATLGALQLIARCAGARPSVVEDLLARLGPVLAQDSAVASPDAAAPASASAPVVVLDGDGPTAARILALLGAEGAEVCSALAADDPALDTADAAVIVAAYAVEPQRHLRWLRRDIPHLPVVFGDAGVTVGPFVRPGAGPCQRCVDLRRRDADPAWPAMATQLHTLPRPGETELVCGAVSSVAAGMVLAGLGGDGLPAGVPAGSTARFDTATARWSERRWSPHPECGCLSLAAALLMEQPDSSGSVGSVGSVGPPERTHVSRSRQGTGKAGG